MAAGLVAAVPAMASDTGLKGHGSAGTETQGPIATGQQAPLPPASQPVTAASPVTPVTPVTPAQPVTAQPVTPVQPAPVAPSGQANPVPAQQPVAQPTPQGVKGVATVTRSERRGEGLLAQRTVRSLPFTGADLGFIAFAGALLLAAGLLLRRHSAARASV